MTEAENSRSPTDEVFVAVPLEALKGSSLSLSLSEMEETTTLQATTATARTSGRRKKADESAALYWLFLSIVLGFLCMNFVSFSFLHRSRMTMPFDVSETSASLTVVSVSRSRDDDEAIHYVERNENTIIGPVPQHAVELTNDSFHTFLKDHPLAIINFCTPASGKCHILRPKWQQFAFKVQELGLPVAVGEVNCDIHVNVCPHQILLTDPTTVWFHNGLWESPVHDSWTLTVGALVTLAVERWDREFQFLSQKIAAKQSKPWI